MRRLLLLAAALAALAGPAAAQVSPGAFTHVQSAALATNLVAKSSQGWLYSFEVQADSTLDAAAWWILMYDGSSAPADGAVTPTKCYAVQSGQPQAGGTFATAGVPFIKGIVIAVSTTGCFTQTSSTHAFIGVDVQ